MTRPILRALLLLPLLCGTANAQEEELPLPEEAEEIRRYTVEMIIFTYNEDVSVGSEVFIPDPAPPEEEVLGKFVLGVEGSDESELVFTDTVDEMLEEVVDDEPLEEIELQVRQMYELVMLREEEFTMNDTYGHLERLDVYEPILHFGWTQPTYPKEETKIRPLTSFVTPPEELGLEGDFQLYLGRYLHLAINLQLDAPSEESDSTIYEFGDYSYTEDEGGRFDSYSVTVEQPVHYRIQEDRIFRSGETRYFDHPKFGVLAKITRWEEPEAGELEEEFLGETELLGLDGE